MSLIRMPLHALSRPWTMTPVWRTISMPKPCMRPAAMQQRLLCGSAASTELREINALFLDSYALRKKEIRQSLGKSLPVILMHGDQLIFLHEGTRRAIKVIPEEYHQLKSIAHISCLLDTLQDLRRRNQQDLAKELQTNALHLLEKILDSPDLQKHRPLLLRYQQLLQAETNQDLGSLREDLKNLLDQAAKCRLSSLHKHVEDLRKELPQETWIRIAVVIMGPPMPRKGDLSMQYFQSALKSDQCPHRKNPIKEIFSEQRLIYAESITEENQALELVVTQKCDEQLGDAVLGDKMAMHADFLMDATRKHLPSILSKT